MMGRGAGEAREDRVGAQDAVGLVEDAVAAAEDGLLEHLVGEADAGRPGDALVEPVIAGVAADAGEGDAAFDLEGLDGQFGHGGAGVVGLGRGFDGVGSAFVEARDGAVVALGDGRFVLGAEAEVDGELAGDFQSSWM
jgi:hypothetical protein